MILFLGCKKNDIEKIQFSSQNRSNFHFSDSLISNYTRFNKSNNKIFKSISDDGVYLYSWQERNPETIEFIVISDSEIETGHSMYYFILNKSNEVISYQHIANYGREGTYVFDLRSQLIGNDTLILTFEQTEWWDLENNKEYSNPIIKQKQIKTMLIDRDNTFRKM